MVRMPLGDKRESWEGIDKIVGVFVLLLLFYRLKNQIFTFGKFCHV